jgi:hypothetical protein
MFRFAASSKHNDFGWQIMVVYRGCTVFKELFDSITRIGNMPQFLFFNFDKDC